MTRYTGIIDRYRSYLPLAPDTEAVSLGEGDTPLIECINLPRQLGFDLRLFVKFEGLNPTGSFKDRGMTMAVTKAKEDGSEMIICASTGNTSAAAAAYAARAGMRAFVVIPEGKIALGKLSQAMMHGALVLQIRGNFDAGMQIVQDVAANAPITLVNSVNPYRLQGQKTAAFEIIEALGEAPDYHALPVGNAGNITAHWMGYCEATDPRCDAQDVLTGACKFCAGQCPYGHRTGASKRPKMLGFQAAGSAPFIAGDFVREPETIATAIRIGRPMSWEQAHQVAKESGGWFAAHSDAEILEAQRWLAQYEGVFCEPASATSVAGVVAAARAGKIEAGAKVVCTLTGHGLKDPDTAIAQGGSVVTVDANLEAVQRAILER
ncbi:threonine synthase [Acidithiobacillus sp. AMEEHan]|uniref:threonine synthase n=1 Tax=Acidithiobacillus sp. AMEEHan TaxID=2994951 RepID=UPI0027E55739|nr:threonine synthase [Acidithiobacillus sp. AMEEHan]